MATVEMTLTEALARRANLVKILERGTLNVDKSEYDPRSGTKNMIYIKKKSDATVQSMSLEEATANAQSAFDKINAALDNYIALSKAINEANVKTMVTIAGKEMSIAQAIVYKNSMVTNTKTSIINICKNQIKFMKSCYDKAQANINNNQTIESFLNATLGENRDPEAVKAQIEMYHSVHDWEIFDPINLEEKVEAMEKEKREFIEEVDTTLAIANASTKITVEFVD